MLALYTVHVHIHVHVSAQESTGRSLKTVMLSVKDKDITGGPWKKIAVDPQTSLLHPLPLPLGGVIAIGYETIAYYNIDVQHAIDPPVVKVHVHILYHVHVQPNQLYY